MRFGPTRNQLFTSPVARMTATTAAPMPENPASAACSVRVASGSSRDGAISSSARAARAPSQTPAASRCRISAGRWIRPCRPSSAAPWPPQARLPSAIAPRPLSANHRARPGRRITPAAMASTATARRTATAKPKALSVTTPLTIAMSRAAAGSPAIIAVCPQSETRLARKTTPATTAKSGRGQCSAAPELRPDAGRP